jgi:hypothetical protein
MIGHAMFVRTSTDAPSKPRRSRSLGIHLLASVLGCSLLLFPLLDFWTLFRFLSSPDSSALPILSLSRSVTGRFCSPNFVRQTMLCGCGPCCPRKVASRCYPVEMLRLEVESRSVVVFVRVALRPRDGRPTW